MNDLYLIGNGFDLAHGLKTSYNDFLLWYFKHIINRISTNKHFEDDLTIVDKRFGTPIQDHDSIDELLKECKQLQVSIKYKHSFFEHIVSSFRKFKWVDIEYEYFEMLKLSYNQIETYGYSNWESSLEEVRDLNSCIEAIKRKLAEYLSSIKIKKEYKNEDICNILTVGNGPLKEDFAEKLFLYFNYTQTMELYSREFIIHQSEVIYIHGKLNDPSNPIILGYGDEMDPHYEKIEYLNNNEFLKNIKSFSYFQTDNYQRVISFIESGDFTVKILGHSCGLSDRILLNTIFEHANCKAIKIYFYKKSETENDYFEKTQEISRHFRASMKGKMREKIISFEKSIPIPQNPKEN